MVECQVHDVRNLVFDDGSPVQAASAVTRLGAGWIVIQDDSTAAAWWVGDSVRRVPVFPPVEGHDTFQEAAGTKHLKPDLEAACPVEVDGRSGVLLLGSGSSERRKRAALLSLADGEPELVTADLARLYDRVANALGIGLDELNLEGACVTGTALRWFQRGNTSAGVPSASVDLPLEHVLDMVVDPTARKEVEAVDVRRYALGDIAGVGLAITDAAALPDGRILVSAAAEDTSNAVDDGEILGAAIALLDGPDVVAVGRLPHTGGEPWKVEGLGLCDVRADGVDVVAVVDQDKPGQPSQALSLTVRW